ncbi:FMN-binding protein [Mogibacterium pumilum]|uniref:Uncharacterized protein n=1 Tax=Mogibacterium pumilum TaxID=86332 RepID=A0A223AR66_9FIRM|nr:FMN-binding protein [Mogibacterium pumilum]ASS37436.1 hypothetical protein AXF17_02455 [Mogibacterium pumilum]
MGKNAILKPILIGALILAVAGGIAFGMLSGGDEKPEKSAVSHKKEHMDMAKEQNEPQASEDKGTAGDYETSSSRDSGSSVFARNSRGGVRARNVISQNTRQNQGSVSNGAKPVGSTPSVSPSKPSVSPSQQGTKPDVKPGEKPGANPGTTPGANPGTNPSVNPGTTPGEPVPPVLDRQAQIEKEISDFMRRSDLKDGKYVGLGDGFDEARGGVKTIVTIKNNIIENVVFVEGQGYSGLDYMAISARAIPYLCGEEGKRNVAILKVYRKYIDQIAHAKDQAKEAEKLLGKEYASKISDARRAEMVSPVIREYLSKNHKCKKMMDAISGATLTTGGVGLSVDNALELSENDKKTGNDITEINVLEPTAINGYTGQRVLKSDIAKPLDLSGVKVELTKEDGTKIEVPYSEFDKYGIEVTNRDTGEKLYDKMNLSDETKSQALIAKITHKGSKRRTEFAIFFESYSTDYITKMEYSFDNGKTWEEVTDPAKAEDNSNNISPRQTVKLKKEYFGKKAKARTTSMSGKHYEYECRFPIDEYGYKFSFNSVNKDYESNKNANFAVYITFVEDVVDENPGTGDNHDNFNPEEGTEVEDEFTPVLSSKIINKKVGDAEPTLDEYKALISNFPNDGSVTLEVLDHPDMTENGYTLVKIKVISHSSGKESIITIGVSVA